jgi:hypothetical protein
MYHTPETLLNHVFEDLWKPKAPNNFLRDHVAKRDIILGVRSEDQLADIFTKPFDKTRFCMLINELNILDLRNFT